jgi:hypothetical protein
VRTPIVRLYDTARQATDAANALRGRGFADHLINMVSGEGNAGSQEDIAKAIMAGWVLKHEAFVYATAVQQGKSLVSIRAPFATGRRCARIMDGFGPAESPVKPTREPLPQWDDAAPLSSALWWPVAVDSSAPFSATFGMATLAREAAPLSRLFCWTTKSRNPTPFSSMLGLPLLAKNPAPFSSMLGLRLLK